MLSRRGLKLLYLASSLASMAVIVGLVLYALRQNIDLFYTPEQLIIAKPIPQSRIRVGGMIKEITAVNGLQIEFIITDYKQEVRVDYVGILPDLFKVGQGVIVLGRYKPAQKFIAEQVLAKHDEKYMPPGLDIKQG